jgi:hypothetical protein
MANKKALVVGINVYKSPVNNLPSCVNDSNHFSAILNKNYGFSLSNIRTLQDTKATLTNIQEDLEWLFLDANPDDRLVFYYSGHGSRVEKDNAYRECLVSSDEQFFFDDELTRFTQSLHPGILTIVLDSCYSGGMEKALYIAKPGEELIKIKTLYQKPQQLAQSVAAEANSNLDYKAFYQPLICSDSSFIELAVSNGLNSHTLQPNGKQVNALLISACKADEVATASTSQTHELSAFTFGLLESIPSLETKISNKALLNATRQKLHDIHLTQQTPLLIEPLQPPGLGDLSFITFEPADKSIVIPSNPEEPSGQQPGTGLTSITVPKAFAVSLDKKELYHKLTEGISYPEAIGYSIKTLKELLSDLQPVNYQWLTYNSGEIGSWNADIKGQQWGTTLCPILPDGDLAYPTIVEELSKAIQVAQEAELLINPYTPEAVEKLMLRLSQAMSASAKIPSMLRDISAPPTPD